MKIRENFWGKWTTKVLQASPFNLVQMESFLNKHFEEFSEAAQVEIYRSASLQLNIGKLKAQISL